jgi:hypothetical protein
MFINSSKMYTLLLCVCSMYMLGCGSAPFARVGLYGQDTYDKVGTIFKSEVGVEWEHWECDWTHLSELDKGIPFHANEIEFGMDMIGCSGQIGGR